MIQNSLRQKTDCVVAVIGIIFGISISLLYLVSPTIYLFSIGMALALSCSLYLFISYAKFPGYNQHNMSKNGKKILDIIFFLLFALSLIILHNSDYRPLIYFCVYSFWVGSVAVSIFFSVSKFDYLIQYSKILLLSFSIEYSIFYLAGFMPSIDTLFHARMNDLLSQTGNIEVLLDKEMYFPIMHIQTAIMEIICNVSIKDASNFAILVPFVLSSIFVYFIAKHFLGDRAGLFAMLLFSISNYYIYWGSAPQTTSYGLILFNLLIYTLIKSYFINSSPKFVAISIFLIFTLIITHAVSSFIFLITVVSLFMGSIFYNLISNGKSVSKLEGISLITLIMLVQRWFTALYSETKGPFFDVIVSSLYYYVVEFAGFLNRPESIPAYSAILPPFLERFADIFGLFLFLFFGIIGSLFCLSNKYKRQVTFLFIFSLIILFSITFAFPLFGLRNIIPSRWFVFEYFFLSILAGFSILKLSTFFKSKIFGSIFIAVIFVSISFFMSASTVSNSDSPLWLKNDTISTTYTLEEIKGAETLSKFGNDFQCDHWFGFTVISGYFEKSEYFEQNVTAFSPNESLNNGKILIWRSSLEKRPTTQEFTILEGYDQLIRTNIILGKSFRSKFTQCDKIYHNDDLSAYYIP